MGELQTWFEFLSGMPLYIILSVGVLIFVGYYFWKIAPKRYKDYQDLAVENSKNAQMFEKVCHQYEKALENSSRVVENNTAALQTTQSVLELTVERIQANNKKVTTLSDEITGLIEKVTDTQVELAKISGKLEK